MQAVVSEEQNSGKSISNALVLGESLEFPSSLALNFSKVSFVQNFQKAIDTADFLEHVTSGKFDLGFVDLDHPSLPEIETTLDELGGPIPVFACSQASEVGNLQAFWRGAPVLPFASIESRLPLFLFMAYSKQQSEQRFRDEKDVLIRQMLDLRDAQERVEDQTAELIEMAEGLEYSKQTLEKLNREKDKLFSIVAHDLRAPFTSIMGYSEMLAETADKLDVDKIKEYARDTHTAASNVFRMMQTLLDWARVQLGQKDFSPTHFELAEVVGEVVNVYSGIAKRKGIKLQAGNVDLVAFGDRGMVETILRNLVNNAIKFTHRGGWVSVESEVNEDWVTVIVSDNGKGMSEDIVRDCFLLESASNQGTANEQGSGLGLPICKELVEKNGGEISVESEPSIGSTFKFTVPAGNSNNEPRR